LAIAALVLGGLGFSFLPLVGSVAALIVGHLARQRIAANPTHWRGDELAMWGIRLGWVAVLLASVLGALVLTMRIMFAPEN